MQYNLAAMYAKGCESQCETLQWSMLTGRSHTIAVDSSVGCLDML